MIRTFLEKYRSERSAEIGLACDISHGLISAVYYDLVMCRRYARAAACGFEYNSRSAAETLIRLISSSMRELGIAASALKKIGIATADRQTERELSSELHTLSGIEAFFVPSVSESIGGRFTASLLTVSEGDFIAADLGRTLCVAKGNGLGLVCASFPLQGAFDGTGLDSGMPAEMGAIDAVRRDGDGTIVYEVVGDGESAGVSPAAAVMAAGIMLDSGALDPDGIMTDRDLFFIGEDFFVSQRDIRAVQADKASAAAAMRIFSASEAPKTAYFSGELLSGGGLKPLLRLGGFPNWCEKASFCRNSAEQGIILCLEEREALEKAHMLAQNAADITETVRNEFDVNYFECLRFPE